MMNMNKTNPFDLRLNLIAGDSLYADNIKIKPFTIREIKDIGFIQYHQYLQIITLSNKDLINVNITEFPEGITPFDIIMYSGNEKLIELFVDAVSFFLRENFIGLIDASLIFGDINKGIDMHKIINKENFNKVVEIIKHQNRMINIENSYNPKDDKAKSIIEKLKKAKDIINRKKNSDSDDIDFVSIVSAVSTKSNHYNFNNIFDLTIYQVYEEYQNLNKIDGFNTSILAMVNGSKDIHLKHWSTKNN